METQKPFPDSQFMTKVRFLTVPEIIKLYGRILTKSERRHLEKIASYPTVKQDIGTKKHPITLSQYLRIYQRRKVKDKIEKTKRTLDKIDLAWLEVKQMMDKV